MAIFDVPTIASAAVAIIIFEFGAIEVHFDEPVLHTMLHRTHKHCAGDTFWRTKLVSWILTA
jgi:hypothetical protein